MVKAYWDPCVKESGWNSMHYAIANDSYGIVEFLIEYDRNYFLETRTSKGWFDGCETPLMIAAKYRKQFLVDLLIRCGADLGA